MGRGVTGDKMEFVSKIIKAADQVMDGHQYQISMSISHRDLVKPVWRLNISTA